MRYAIYQNFYETLKQFVEDENFVIKYQIFGDVYVLAFNKKEKEFYFKEGQRRFPKMKDTYKIIKNHVEQLIVKKQKEVFNGSFEKTKSFKIKFLNEDDEKIFLELLNKFKDFLWEEPIFASDISFKDSSRSITYGFSNSKVSWVFFQYIIEIMQKFPKAFENGIIYYYMWPKSVIDGKDYKDEVKKLVEEEYATVQKDTSGITIYALAFTRKFYDSLKKAFYYDFDIPVSVDFIAKFENV